LPGVDDPGRREVDVSLLAGLIRWVPPTLNMSPRSIAFWIAGGEVFAGKA